MVFDAECRWKYDHKRYAHQKEEHKIHICNCPVCKKGLYQQKVRVWL